MNHVKCSWAGPRIVTRALYIYFKGSDSPKGSPFYSQPEPMITVFAYLSITAEFAHGILKFMGFDSLDPRPLSNNQD